MKKPVLLFALALICGCGGGTGSSMSGVPSAPVSTWAGNYSGNLKFTGCPGTTPCGGDAATITISEAASGTGFSPALIFSGTDSTSKQTITGTGTALYAGAAPVGPGSESTNANANITPGGSIYLLGSGQSTSGPVLVQTIAINNTSTVAGAAVKGPLYFGTLTRVP
jgi:hypothetical protein